MEGWLPELSAAWTILACLFIIALGIKFQKEIKKSRRDLKLELEKLELEKQKSLKAIQKARTDFNCRLQGIPYPYLPELLSYDPQIWKEDETSGQDERVRILSSADQTVLFCDFRDIRSDESYAYIIFDDNGQIHDIYGSPPLPEQSTWVDFIFGPANSRSREWPDLDKQKAVDAWQSYCQTASPYLNMEAVKGASEAFSATARDHWKSAYNSYLTNPHLNQLRTTFPLLAQRFSRLNANNPNGLNIDLRAEIKYLAQQIFELEKPADRAFIEWIRACQNHMDLKELSGADWETWARQISETKTLTVDRAKKLDLITLLLMWWATPWPNLSEKALLHPLGVKQRVEEEIERWEKCLKFHPHERERTEKEFIEGLTKVMRKSSELAQQNPRPQFKDWNELLEANWNRLYVGTALECPIGKFLPLTWGADFTFGRYSAHLIQTTDALLRETQIMRHCAAQYWKKCLSRELFVWSIEITENQKHFATVGLTNEGKLFDARGKYNAAMSEEFKQAFLKVWKNLQTFECCETHKGLRIWPGPLAREDEQHFVGNRQENF